MKSNQDIFHQIAICYCLIISLSIHFAWSQSATINWNEVHQKITGFGASGGNDSGNELMKLPISDREKLFDLMFDKTKGIGLSMVRNELYSFRIEPEKGVWNWNQDSAQIYIMQEAKKRGITHFHSCSWSPPAWMKDNNSIKGGGRLKIENYKDYAELLTRYVKEYKSRFDLDILGISVQNEPNYAAPYQSCVWEGPDFARFIKDHLAPDFKNNGIKAKIIIADDGDSWLFGRCDDSIDDPDIASNLSILSCHQYGWKDIGECYRYEKGLNKGKEIWQTEASTIGKLEENIDNGIYWSKAIFDAIVNGDASAWLYWTFISPWGDSEGIVSPKDGTFVIPKRYYCIGNWSKFVRPGFYRIGVSNDANRKIHITAFKNNITKEFVIIAINDSQKPTTLDIKFKDFKAYSIIPWVTSGDDNLLKKDSIKTIKRGLKTVLGPECIVTFTGKSR